MKVILGLGNIGAKYAKTRHNAGFIALDVLVEQLEKETDLQVKWKEDGKLKALTAKVPYNGKVLFLAKPTTLMNLSGLSASSILNFFKEPVDNLIVTYDDIDLPLGKIRIRETGSAGTHNGMKSLIQELGTQDFTRVRIGIESRGDITPRQQELSSFVLSDFTEPEIPYLKQGIEEAVREIKKLISGTPTK